MGSLLSYSGLSTKIRAMQSKLIRESQYQEISQMDSVTQVVAYLKKQPGFSDLWADLDENSLHRGDIEKLLVHTIHQNFAKLYRFANPQQRTFMALYFKRYELSVMKDCLGKSLTRVTQIWICRCSKNFSTDIPDWTLKSWLPRLQLQNLSAICRVLSIMPRS